MYVTCTVAVATDSQFKQMGVRFASEMMTEGALVWVVDALLVTT